MPSVAKQHANIPPSLGTALWQVRDDLGLTPAQCSHQWGLSIAALDRLERGHGRLTTFCDLIDRLGYRIDIRTWEYKRLMPLEDTIDPRKLCAGLVAYMSSHLRTLNQQCKLWPTTNQRIAVQLAEPTCSLNAFEAYARSLALHCCLVPVPCDGKQ